jgi:hypothetical protein
MRTKSWIICVLLIGAALFFAQEKTEATGIPVIDAASLSAHLVEWARMAEELQVDRQWQRDLLDKAVAQLRKANEMVEKGTEILRVAGDPAALIGALGFTDLAKTVENVQKVVGDGMSVFQQGYSLYTLGENIFKSAQSGDVQGVLAMAGLGQWGRLGSLNNPEQIIMYATTTNFSGHGALRQSYEGIQTWEDAVEPEKKRLVDEINRVIARLGQAKDDAEIQLLMGQLAGLQLQASQMGDEALAIYLKQLVDGDAWRTAQDAQARAQISANAKLQLDKYKENLLEAARRQQEFLQQNQQRPVGDSLREMNLMDPSRDAPSGSFRGVEAPGGNSQAAWRYINSRQSTTGRCLRGANNVLLSYLGRPTMARAGWPVAKTAGPLLQQRFGMIPVPDTGVYRNGDTRILQPRDPGGAGHIEVYMDGKWVSDHVQRGHSLNNPRYTTSQLYRLPG